MKERNTDKMIVLLFWVKWYPESTEIRNELNRLASKLNYLIVGWCDCDRDITLVQHYEISKVPFILLMHVSQTKIKYRAAKQVAVRVHQKSEKREPRSDSLRL